MSIQGQFPHIVFLSNAGTGCFGVGGSPGESVFLKAGFSLEEPKALLDENGYLRMNIDKGIQGGGGEDMDIVSNVANGIRVCHDTPYASLTKYYSHKNTLLVEEDSLIWLALGTDSAFESKTTLYFDSIKVSFEHVE